MKIEELILEKFENSDITMTELAKKMNRSLSQISRELKKMRAGKSIFTYTANQYLKILNIHLELLIS